MSQNSILKFGFLTNFLFAKDAFFPLLINDPGRRRRSQISNSRFLPPKKAFFFFLDFAGSIFCRRWSIRNDWDIFRAFFQTSLAPWQCWTNSKIPFTRRSISQLLFFLAFFGLFFQGSSELEWRRRRKIFWQGFLSSSTKAKVTGFFPGKKFRLFFFGRGLHFLGWNVLLCSEVERPDIDLNDGLGKQDPEKGLRWGDFLGTITNCCYGLLNDHWITFIYFSRPGIANFMMMMTKSSDFWVFSALFCKERSLFCSAWWKIFLFSADASQPVSFSFSSSRNKTGKD